MSTLLQSFKKMPLAARLNSLLKARLQEKRAARNQLQYVTEAALRGLILPDEPGLATALRSRLQNRPHPQWPKSRGALHVFMPYYLENWEYILPISLAPFGKVTVFDWRSQGYDPHAADWLTRRDAMNADMLRAFHAAQAGQPVDAVLGYLSGHNTAPETLLEMARSGAAIYNICYDDKLHMPGYMLGGRDTSPAGIAHAVDLNLTNAPDSLIKYCVHGGLAVFCPSGAQPEIHAPQPGGFEYDVSFIGTNYGQRPDFIKALQKEGVRVACFGKGWPGGSVSDSEIIRIFSHSRINLGMAGVGHSSKLCCIKGRDFEIPMCGGLYLTQEHADLARVYDAGKEIVTYRSPADCASTIKTLLADPERASKIRLAGRERARHEHSWEVRWERVFRLAGILN